jgi:pilus assembly protein Flp/PilA
MEENRIRSALMKEGVMDDRKDGQAMVEYALILVLIAVVVIGVLLLLGGQIKGIFSSIAGALGAH